MEVYHGGQGAAGWYTRILPVLAVVALQLAMFYLSYEVYRIVPYGEYISVETPLDGMIPYVRWSWVIYYFGFIYIPTWAAAGIWNLPRRNLVRTTQVYATLVLAGTLVRILVPTRAPWPPFDEITNVQQSFKIACHTEPLASFPSMHVAMAVLPALISMRVFKGSNSRRISIILAGLVSLSVLTAKEHWVLDVLSGLLLGIIAYRVWKPYAMGQQVVKRTISGAFAGGSGGNWPDG